MKPKNPAKKRPSKKTAAMAEVRRTAISDISPEEQLVGAPLIGKVKSYDANSREMTLTLEEAVSVGDALRVKGRETDLIQRVERMRVNRRAAQSALAGETATLEVADRVRPGDAVWKL